MPAIFRKKMQQPSASCFFSLNISKEHKKLRCMENSFINTLKSRRSCRHYQPQQITDEELNAVLEACTWAPTAHGAQDPVIVAVQNAELRQELVALNARVRGGSADPYYGAPTLVLVFVSANNENGLQDGSCVLQNMMLAAHALGLGSCWINREIQMFNMPEGKELMQKMGLPEGLAGVGAISLGYEATEPAAPKPRKADYFRIIR